MSEMNTVEKAQDQLMAFAIAWLARWSGQDPGALLKYWPGADGQALEPYRPLLGTFGAPTEPGSALLSIFSRVRDPFGGVEPTAHYWQPQELSLEHVPVPAQEATVSESTLAGWWKGFEQDAAALLERPASAGARFEMFTHLLHKWAWAVPCSYGEPGVSAYDEVRALSALVHASGCAEQPASEFLLVAGDIPGIQSFVYTITSKGAAKGLRGRSFFIQLLGDAVVRRLLAELSLPQTNVIYTAGGNFMLLAQSALTQVNGEAVEDKLARIQQEIDKALLSDFEGDLSICLAWADLRSDQLGSHGFADPVSRELKRLIADKKRQRFSTICEQQWNSLFGPRGEPGNRYCVICQRPLSRGEGVPMVDDVAPPQEEQARRCSVCDGFQKLAESLGRPGLLATGLRRPHTTGEAWQEALWQVGRTWFSFGSYTELAQLSENSLYTVNDTNFLKSDAQIVSLLSVAGR